MLDEGEPGVTQDRRLRALYALVLVTLLLLVAAFSAISILFR